MAGHSAWKNIKHKKAAADAKRGKAWSKCARLIIVAARNGGGDPASNLALRYAMEEGRAVNMPKDTIEKAIKKGTGELGAENYEAALYEGYGPNGVAILLDILTDNRNRTSPEIKLLFQKFGGNLGALALGFLRLPDAAASDRAPRARATRIKSRPRCSTPGRRTWWTAAISGRCCAIQAT